MECHCLFPNWGIPAAPFMTTKFVFVFSSSFTVPSCQQLEILARYLVENHVFCKSHSDNLIPFLPKLIPSVYLSSLISLANLQVLCWTRVVTVYCLFSFTNFPGVRKPKHFRRIADLLMGHTMHLYPEEPFAVWASIYGSRGKSRWWYESQGMSVLSWLISARHVSSGIPGQANTTGSGGEDASTTVNGKTSSSGNIISLESSNLVSPTSSGSSQTSPSQCIVSHYFPISALMFTSGVLWD